MNPGYYILEDSPDSHRPRTSKQRGILRIIAQRFESNFRQNNVSLLIKRISQSVNKQYKFL